MNIAEELTDVIIDGTWQNSKWVTFHEKIATFVFHDRSNHRTEYPYQFKTEDGSTFWTDREGHCRENVFSIRQKYEEPANEGAAVQISETLALPEMPYQEETALAQKQMIENLWAYVSKCQLEVEKSLKALEDLDQKFQVHHCRLSIAKVHLTHATEPGSTDSPRYNYQCPAGPDVLPDGWSRDGQKLYARSDHPAIGREF